MVPPCSPWNPVPAGLPWLAWRPSCHPKAIVIVSAHWESHELLVSGIHNLKPGMTSAVSQSLV
jgi:aromatic ring-opening dioxygenase catalytic subunit (LigB family)